MSWSIHTYSTNLCNSRPFNFSSASRRLESHKFQMSFLTKKTGRYMSLVNGHYSTLRVLLKLLYANNRRRKKFDWHILKLCFKKTTRWDRYADVDLGFYIFLLYVVLTFTIQIKSKDSESTKMIHTAVQLNSDLKLAGPTLYVLYCVYCIYFSFCWVFGLLSAIGN